jgi:hypothetical protein
MRAFGDARHDEVTTADVSAFLRELDREGLTPRNVNKHRQVLAAIFKYVCRADIYALAVNPATGTDKHREGRPAALDYYEVHDVEALACACERDEQPVGRTIIDPNEVVVRAREGRQDAEAWADVDPVDRILLVRRGLSAGEESAPKGATPPLRAVIGTVSALARLAARDGSRARTATCSPTATAAGSSRHRLLLAACCDRVGGGDEIPVEPTDTDPGAEGIGYAGSAERERNGSPQAAECGFLCLK